MNTRARFLYILLAGCLASLTGPAFLAAAEPGEYFVYFGTYTGQKSQGIYVSRLDTRAGRLSDPVLAAETASPSWIAIHPGQRFLFAANEIGNYEGQKSGSISAFAIEPGNGKLKFLNRVSSRGGAPCHLAVDATGKTLLVANYSGGNIAAFPIAADGTLGEAASFIQHHGRSVNPGRQEGPHAHSVNISPDNRFVVAADLGMDQLLVYKLDGAKASLAPKPATVALGPGSGPRHFAFLPGGKFAYSINELNSTISGFGYDPDAGALKELQTLSTLPGTFKESNSTAEVRAHPSGKFLYGSNRGMDTIAVFAVAADGKLTPVEHVSTQGQVPRGFALDPSGRFLIAANQKSDSVVVFRVDAKTGRLTPTGQTLQVGTPVDVAFVPVR